MAKKQSIAKRVIIDELDEQMHPEMVEDVIFWALGFYAEHKKDTLGGVIAYAIKERILDEENEFKKKNN